MKLQHPTTGETVICRSGSVYCKQLLNTGWKNVTPPRSTKQIAQNTRWVQMGQLAAAHSNLDNVKRIYNFPPNQLAILDQASSVIAANLKQLKGGG